MKNHKTLKVWEKSIYLTETIYSITKQFPKSEIYGLSSQMQRSVVSIPSNIAEGYNRNHKNEYIQFLSIAKGSLAELDTQVIIAEKQYPKIDYKIAKSEIEQLYYMMTSLINKLKALP